MWIETAEGRKLIEETSKSVVTQVAPEELELFDELLQDYFENPQPSNPPASTHDDPLGFGLGEALVAVTPAAAAMASTVLSYLMTEAIKATQEESAAAIKKKLKALFNPEKEKDSLPPLTGEQLAQVKKLAHKQ